MRKSSRKTMKRTGSKLPATMLVLVVMAVVVLFTKGCFFRNQPAVQDEEQAGNILNPAGDVAGHWNILDRGHRELAVSFMMKSLYARPPEIVDIDKTAAFLAGDLGLDEKQLSGELKSERSFVWLGRRLPESRADLILKKGIKGINAVTEAQRFYPARNTTAHVVGFLEEDHALAGVEFYYDNILRRNSAGSGVGGEGGNGHLQLTLDLRVQKMLAGGLSDLLKETGAPSGSGLLMDLASGAILAMVSLPDFDPNSYWDSSSAGRRNRAVTGMVSVGGFKSLFGLIASGEGGGEVGPNQLAAVKMDLLQGSLLPRSPGGKWFAPVDNELLSPELQVWSAKALGVDGQPPFGEYFGLFGKTGIDLPETDDGVVRESGQTTPLNLLTAFAGLVNGGIGITPHLGEAVIEPRSGRHLLLEHPGKAGLVRAETSRKIIELLTAVSPVNSEAIILESMGIVQPERAEAVGEGQATDLGLVRYQTVMIGFIPDRKPGLALLVALDQAIVDLNKKTPMRSMGEALIGRMMKRAAETVVSPSPEIMAAREKQLYDEWLQTQVVAEKDHQDDGGPARQGAMPDLQGLSLRKALRKLQQLDVQVAIAGSGRVVGQEPQAGVLISGDKCLLTLRADN